MSLQLQDTSFHGHAAAYFILRPVAAADTFKKNLIVIEPTDKQFVIPRLEITNFIQDYSPNPTDNSTLVVDATIIPINMWNIFTKFNPLDFKEHWQAPNMQDEMINAPLPQVASTYLLKHMMDLTNLNVDMEIWRGDTRMNPALGVSARSPLTNGLPLVDQNVQQNSLHHFDGLIKQLQLDANTILVSSPVTLTATNSVAALEACYEAVATNIPAYVGEYGPTGLRFSFSKHTQALIEENYNITTTFKNWGYSESITNLFLNYEMVSVSGMPDNTIVATYQSSDPSRTQFWFAVNSERDQANLVMEKYLPSSDEWFIKGIIKAGVGIGFTDKVVLYTTLTYNA